MNINCLEIDEQLNLKPYPADLAVAAAKNGEAIIWLSLGDCQAEEDIEKWLDELSVSALSRHLLTTPHNRSGFYPLKKELLFITPYVPLASDSSEVVFVPFLCMKNILITLHPKAFYQSQHSDLLSESASWLHGRSIAGLVSAMMIGMTLRTMQGVTELRNAVTSLEEKMDRDPYTVEIDEIMNLRSDLLVNEALTYDSLPCLTPLNTFDKGFFSHKEAEEYLNCALGNMQAVDRSLTLIRTRIEYLHSEFDSNVQNKTNHRLNMLTILSAIFMPITLLAGIWGMNFEKMPELGFALGYPLALGSMVLIAMAMLFLFRKGGWFD